MNLQKMQKQRDVTSAVSNPSAIDESKKGRECLEPRCLKQGWHFPPWHPQMVSLAKDAELH
jgi:hypothetical protein